MRDALISTPVAEFQHLTGTHPHESEPNMENGKVSVPPHKAPASPTNQPPVKTSSNVKGFGGASASFTATQPIAKEGRSIKGFSGSGVKGGKV